MSADESAREAAALHLWDEGIVRPESTAFAVVDFLVREGYMSLSSPPADDVREALAEAERVAQVRLERITQLLDAPALTPDERDWFLDVARRVKHETEHPTAVDSLRALRVGRRHAIPDDLREVLARTIWTAGFVFSHPGRTPIVQWEDVPTSASRQKARAQADAILAAKVRPYGTVTDAEVERAAKHLWVIAQDDEQWARSVVDDVFSPADDWPEEALEAAEIARGVLEAAREARS